MTFTPAFGLHQYENPNPSLIRTHPGANQHVNYRIHILLICTVEPHTKTPARGLCTAQPRTNIMNIYQDALE